MELDPVSFTLSPFFCAGDITPPVSVKAAMDMQAEAERRKRAEILQSEGEREAAINSAQGSRQGIVLRAQGDAEAIIAKAKATGLGVQYLARSIRKNGGSKAVNLRIAEQYVQAFSKIAKKGNTILLPSNASDAGSMVAQALSIFDNMQTSKQKSENDEEAEEEEDEGDEIDESTIFDEEMGKAMERLQEGKSPHSSKDAEFTPKDFTAENNPQQSKS